MMAKKQDYRNFSWDLHKKAGHKPIVGQFELTYRCPLHCSHCFTACFNNKASSKEELSTKEVKSILDKCKQAGVLWLCFTGGDPLVRKDFIEIYTYAKRLGFIITIFSSLIPLNAKILGVLKKYPPFDIVTTLNACTAQQYKKVTKTLFFKKHVVNIKKLLANKLPLEIRTMVTKQNVLKIKGVKAFVESCGLTFNCLTSICASLDQDNSPCALRLDPKENVKINKLYVWKEKPAFSRPTLKPNDARLFNCGVAGGHAFEILPDGKMCSCSFLRQPQYDLLKPSATVKSGFYAISNSLHNRRFKTNSPCRQCSYRSLCTWCPARAYLEKGDYEAPIDYFCQVAKATLQEYR